MRKVQRSEIVDYQTYTETRGETRPRILSEKKLRRLHVGEHLTFLFRESRYHSVPNSRDYAYRTHC